MTSRYPSLTASNQGTHLSVKHVTLVISKLQVNVILLSTGVFSMSTALDYVRYANHHIMLIPEDSAALNLPTAKM